MAFDSNASESIWTTFSGAGALAAVLLTLLGFFCWRQILHGLGLFGVQHAEEEGGPLYDRELKYERHKLRIEDALEIQGLDVTSSRATDLTRQLSVVAAKAAGLRERREWREKYRRPGWVRREVRVWWRKWVGGFFVGVWGAVVWLVGAVVYAGAAGCVMVGKGVRGGWRVGGGLAAREKVSEWGQRVVSLWGEKKREQMGA